ncbi:prepilin peptidase [Lentilactobacillus kisonensis]|nr:A24 family peptidase [Lentilactobacillus kisonensis]EHO53349.1 bacterial peptidase A24 protein [Lentilactobacillus kisonensis F0435]
MILIQFILGSSIASFISLVVSRHLVGESIVIPRSHCDSCQHPLCYYDLIPIISYLTLRGRCRYCRAKIPPTTIIVEFVLGVLFILTPLDFFNVIFLLNVIILLALSLFDISTQRVPTLGILFLLITYIISGHHTSHQLIIATLFYIVSQLINYRERFIGNGDIDILICLWLPTNLGFMLWVTCLACISAIIYLLIIPWPNNNKIPFVPFITIGYVLTHHF